MKTTHPLSTSHFSSLTTTGQRPLYQEVHECMQDELLNDGLPSHPLDAPCFAQAGSHYKQPSMYGSAPRPLPGIVLLDGRVA